MNIASLIIKNTLNSSLPFFLLKKGAYPPWTFGSGTPLSFALFMFTSPQVVEAIRCLVDPTYQFVSARLGLPLLGLLRSSEPITLIMQSQIVDGQRLLQSSISVLVHTLLSE